jgi:lysophospholipase L1-like esterase
MTHIVLLGDSIFDNAAYVAGGPDVVRPLREILPTGWRATLNALDGAVIADVPQQLKKLPRDATHLVLSIGGNDALADAGLLERKVASMAEALELITQVRERFRSAYTRMLDHALQSKLPLAVCTIYEARFPEPAIRRVAATALTALNDAITRQAFARNIDCIDLRILCDDDRDFANPIEPSVQGGAKIARAILGFTALPPERLPRVITR